MLTGWSTSIPWNFFFLLYCSHLVEIKGSVMTLNPSLSLCFYFVFRWFNFEKVVKALTAKKWCYLPLEQLQGIIRRFCFIEDEDEVATMLDFYHDLGLIVRHGNTVVLRAQWLIEVFRQLITIRSFNKMVKTCVIISTFTVWCSKLKWLQASPPL